MTNNPIKIQVLFFLGITSIMIAIVARRTIIFQIYGANLKYTIKQSA